MSTSVRASALIFADPRSRQVRELLHQVAPSDASLLVIGETGTGKELVARRLHELSRRREGPFLAVNCGAFSENLIDSELFGHEQGAFTGADQAKAGWFEAAHGGTIFLDEIGDLPPALQVKLLRVIQEREVVRVGSRKPIPIDVRLIAATNVDLEDAVRAGRFRADLYYRIKVVTLPLPPLRERPGDILPLAQFFLDRYGDRLGVHADLSDEVAAMLELYSWPGNIRELENVIHRALLICQDGVLCPRDLQLPEMGTATSRQTLDPSAKPPLADDLGELRRALLELYAAEQPDLYERIHACLVETAFDSCRRNQVRTAQMLGISRNVLRTLLKRYGHIAAPDQT